MLTAPDMQPRKHLVLIHGAWQGAWAFDAWRGHLSGAGWTVHTPDLPGNGWGPDAAAPASLVAYASHVAACVRRLDGPVVVLGHSGGGITATAVAEALPERLAAVVYLAGIMLPAGRSHAELVAELQATQPGLALGGIVPHLQWSADRRTTWVPEPAALDIFLHDCEPAAARRAAALLRPQPESGRALRPQWTAQRAGRVPRLYVECAQDRSIVPAVQQHFQRSSPGAERLLLDCGHVPQLACPAELTAALLPRLDMLLALPPSPTLPPMPATASSSPTVAQDLP